MKAGNPELTHDKAQLNHRTTDSSPLEGKLQEATRDTENSIKFCNRRHLGHNKLAAAVPRATLATSVSWKMGLCWGSTHLCSLFSRTRPLLHNVPHPFSLLTCIKAVHNGRDLTLFPALSIKGVWEI